MIYPTFVRIMAENEELSNSFPWGYQFRKMQHMISVSSEHIACVYEKVYNEIATLYADLVNLPCN